MTRRFFNLLACGATTVPAVATAPAPRKKAPRIPGLGGLAAQIRAYGGPYKWPRDAQKFLDAGLYIPNPEGKWFSGRRDLNELGANR